jgi:hypothetical protein
MFDFRDFLKNKYGLDDMSIEHLIQLKIAAKREYVYGDLELLDTEDITHLLISRMSRTIAEFAKEEEYKNYEGLGARIKESSYVSCKSSEYLDITTYLILGYNNHLLNLSKQLQNESIIRH